MMKKKTPFNSLLVPTDFSENAWSAFQHARLLVDDEESEIVVVHVIDHAIVNQIVELGISDHDQTCKSLRENAKANMKQYDAESSESTQVDTLICEGEPFFEIVRKAEEFAVDAIVMSKLGQRSQAKSQLGSTAEKVTRGSKKPVIVLPCN